MMTNENSTESTDGASTATAGGGNRYAELQQMVAAMASDFEKFYKDGNKAAGTRVRLAMQELKNFAQTIRVEVQTMKNGGKAGGDAGDADADA